MTKIQEHLFIMATALFCPVENSVTFSSRFKEKVVDEELYSVDALQRLLQLYKMQVSIPDVESVCSGGMQQYLIRSAQLDSSQSLSGIVLLPVWFCTVRVAM